MTRADYRPVALRYLMQCLDGRRIPLNREQRSEVPGDVPYWGAGGIVDQVSESLFDEELVLLGEDGAPFFERGRDVSFRVTGPVWINNHIHVLRPRGVDAQFLTYALNSIDYGQYITGSTRDKLTQEDMREIVISIPSAEIQRRTVSYLDRETAQIDELIGKQNALIELLGERRKAVITRAVTKGLDPSAKTKDSGSALVGAIPVHWSPARLRDTLASLRGGVSVNGSDARADESEQGVLTTGAVSSGIFNVLSHKLVFGEEAGRLACPVQKGTVVVNRANTPDLVGSAAFVAHSAPNIYLSDLLWALSFSRGVNPEFIGWWMQTPLYRFQVAVSRVGTSASMQKISQASLRSYLLALPPPAEQAAIVSAIKTKTELLDTLTAKTQQVIERLLERRSALITAAVTGKTDVRGTV